jgi:hypothetical protein
LPSFCFSFDHFILCLTRRAFLGLTNQHFGHHAKRL